MLETWALVILINKFCQLHFQTALPIITIYKPRCSMSSGMFAVNK